MIFTKAITQVHYTSGILSTQDTHKGAVQDKHILHQLGFLRARPLLFGSCHCTALFFKGWNGFLLTCFPCLIFHSMTRSMC